MTKKKLIIIIFGLVLSGLLLVISVTYNRTQKINSEDISLKLPELSKEDDKNVEISVEPRFDFKYRFAGETIVIEPFSLLKDGATYFVTVNYTDSQNQETTATESFIFEDKSKPAELLKLTPLANQQFSLYSTDRHHFYVRVTASGETEDSAINYAEKILKKYDIDPESVQVEVEFSRGAKEDGSYDPFAPVN